MKPKQTMYSISCFFCLVFLYGQVLSHNNDPFFNSHNFNNNNNNLNHHSNFHKFNQTSPNGENEHDQVSKAEESESLFLSSYTQYEQEQEEEPIIMSLSSASSSIEALLCSGGDDSPSTFVSMECSFTMHGGDNNENDGDDQHHQNDSHHEKNNMNKDTPDSQINIIMYPNNNNNYINSQQQDSQLSYQHYFDLDDYFNSDDDESSDDDDNDDDDGHSSMLSNASVGRRNNRVPVSVGGDDGDYYNGGSSRSKNRSHDESNRDRDRNNNRFSSSTSISSVPAIAHSSKSLLFSIRGGAIAQKKKPSQHETLSKNTISKSSSVTTQTSKIITNNNNNNTQHNEFIRSLIVSTIVAVTYDAIFGHPLEFLKIVMQTSASDTTYSQILKDVTQSSTGIVGIWDGFLPWGLIQSTLKGSVFGFTKEIVQSYLINPSSTLRIAMIAGIAGGCQGYALSPMLLLKTRVMTNPIFRDQTSLWSTILLSMTVGTQIIQEEGFRVLLKGSNIFAVKRVFDWSTRFYFATLFSKMIQSLSSSSSQSSYTLLLSDFLGGTASTLVTTPLDVLVAKIQDSKSAGIKMNAFQMIREELEEKGIEGFSQTYTKGFFARLLDVCGTTMAMKTGTKLLYEFLYNKER